MPRIIIIGECSFEMVFPAHRHSVWPIQIQGKAAGILLDTAIRLTSAACNVAFVGEAGMDALGDMLVAFLADHNVDTECIDRFSDGGITTSIISVPGHAGIINRKFPQGARFNPRWPRIDAGDIVVFGGYLSIADRSHQQVLEIAQYARDRHAMVIYAPGYHAGSVSRITKVMPAIIDNLEVSHIVITESSHLADIWNRPEPRACFDSNISFYTPLMVNIHADTSAISLLHRYNGHEEANATATGATVEQATSRALAALIIALLKLGIDPNEIDTLQPARIASLCRQLADNTSTL